MNILAAITFTDIEINLVEAVCSFALGVLVGWIVKYFLNRLKKFTIKGLLALSPVIFGTALSAVIKPSAETTVWFYFLGLFVGVFLTMLAADLDGKQKKGNLYYLSGLLKNKKQERQSDKETENKEDSI